MKGKGFAESVKYDRAAEAPVTEAKNDECTIMDQIKAQDFFWVNRKVHVENVHSHSTQTGTSLWGSFQKWNWNLDFPDKNPSHVPLKIIDDRVKFLESTGKIGAEGKDVGHEDGSA